MYRRFSNTGVLKDKLVPFLQGNNKEYSNDKDGKEFKKLFREFVGGFDYQLRPMKDLADKIDLCLIDVGSGSDTRLMVR